MTEPFSIFGPVQGTLAVEKAILDLAQTWLSIYLNAAATKAGFTAGSIAYPQSYQRSFDFDNFDEALLPTFVIVCPGTVHEFERGEAGEIGAWFGIEAAILIADQTEALTRRVASIYASAIALMLEQRGSLGGLSDQTLSQKIFTHLPVKENRTLVLGQVNSETFVNSIMDKEAGPPIGAFPGQFEETPYESPAHPWPDWTEINKAVIDVDAESSSEPLD